VLKYAAARTWQMTKDVAKYRLASAKCADLFAIVVPGTVAKQTKTFWLDCLFTFLAITGRLPRHRLIT
jgi:hypothetical protein